MKAKVITWLLFAILLQPSRSLGILSENRHLIQEISGNDHPGGISGPTKISLPLVMRDYCHPSIFFTYKPPFDTYQDLQGQISCAQPSDYKVAIYVYDSGWKNKPTLDSPLTSIQNDGTWTCDITTELYDSISTGVAAFLVPDGYDPPLLYRVNPLPVEIFENAAAYVIEDRFPDYRLIQFSGYTWKVKFSETMDGPGPNYFSDSPNDVWVDANGKLHLLVSYHDGKWYSTEVITTDSFGYGTYTFKLASKPDLLDKNVVLGLFTWDDYAPQDGFREFDIEFSRWGQDFNDNSQYYVEPWNNGGHLYRFNMLSQGNNSTHRFIWSSSDITFSSYDGLTPGPGSQIATWVYSGSDLAQAGQGNVRIDLWQIDGQPPSDGQPVEVVIDSFSFNSP